LKEEEFTSTTELDDYMQTYESQLSHDWLFSNLE